MAVLIIVTIFQAAEGMFMNRGSCVSWSPLEECALWNMGMCGATHDRRLGFVLEIARNMEECEVKDDMVENSVE